MANTKIEDLPVIAEIDIDSEMIVPIVNKHINLDGTVHALRTCKIKDLIKIIVGKVKENKCIKIHYDESGAVILTYLKN